MARTALTLGIALLATACGTRSSSVGDAPVASGSAPASASGRAAPTPLEEDAQTAAASNPLGLPPAKGTLKEGRRVFTFTEPMMASARLGATLALSSGTVVGLEGDDLIIEGHERTYKVHPGYVIPTPIVPKLHIGDPVLTEQNGLMRHAVVLRFVKELVAVRYVDVTGKASEALLSATTAPPKAGVPVKTARFVVQTAGLVAGNFAALQHGDELAHVLLVSSSGDGTSRRWFVLGFGGAAMIVDESDLRPIPVKWSPKMGATVLAESSGVMRRAVVQGVDEPGLYLIKYARAGRPVTVGWGLVMPPDR